MKEHDPMHHYMKMHQGERIDYSLVANSVVKPALDVMLQTGKIIGQYKLNEPNQLLGDMVIWIPERKKKCEK